jgi:hypothetical protein
MTRESAIDLLDNLIGFVEDNHGSDYDEALKLAIKALEQTRWIPIKTRPMTEEEKEEYEYEYPYIYDCPLPDDGQDVFITTCRGNVTVDTFCRDYEGCYFETYCDDGDVVAWMPLLEPYKAESEE